MKFTRFERYEPINFSTRKAVAFQKKLQRERDSLPLLADQIAEEQQDWETEKEKRQRRAQLSEQRMRAFCARTWRLARAEYFAMPADLRAACRAEWNAWRGPLNETSFIYVVRKYNGWHEEVSRRFRLEQRALRQMLADEAQANEQLEITAP